MAEEKLLKGFNEEARTVCVPSADKKAVSLFRCQGCGKLVTDYSLYLFGECWNCGGHKVCGGREGLLERLALSLWLDVPFFRVLKWFRMRKEESAIR